MKVEDRKGGATRQRKADTVLREEILGLTSRGLNRRRAVEASRKGCCPVGRSLGARAIWGREAGAKRKRSGVYG